MHSNMPEQIYSCSSCVSMKLQSQKPTKPVLFLSFFFFRGGLGGGMFFFKKTVKAENVKKYRRKVLQPEILELPNKIKPIRLSWPLTAALAFCRQLQMADAQQCNFISHLHVPSSRSYGYQWCREEYSGRLSNHSGYWMDWMYFYCKHRNYPGIGKRTAKQQSTRASDLDGCLQPAIQELLCVVKLEGLSTLSISHGY